MLLSYTLEFHTAKKKTKIPDTLNQTAWIQVLFRVFKNVNQAPGTFPLTTSLIFLVHTCELALGS